MKKLNKKGMSFTEVLMALMIAGLVAAGTVTGISSAIRTYRQSVQCTEAQLLANTLSDAVLHELRFARNLKTDAEGTVSFTSALYGDGVSFGVNPAGQISLGGAGGSYLLVGDGAYSAGSLKAALTIRDSGSHYAVELSVCDEQDRPIRTVQFSVKPFNYPG